MPENPTPAFRERAPLTSPGDDGRGTPPPGGLSRAPLAFWATLLVYAALRQTGIGLAMYIVVPTVLVLLVLLAVKADRARGRPLAERYLAVWPYAWRGLWVVIVLHCVLLAVAIPVLLLFLSWILPPLRDASVVLFLEVAAFFLVLAGLSAWMAFRGHRAAYAVADMGAKAALSITGGAIRNPGPDS